ncbi:uncharacterized protein [Diadema setosum]|uniref:uncharacterized protein n=1 Tax=Diadema setosum TaxID=31175 RepID=UPI003B3B6D78
MASDTGTLIPKPLEPLPDIEIVRGSMPETPAFLLRDPATFRRNPQLVLRPLRTVKEEKESDGDRSGRGRVRSTTGGKKKSRCHSKEKSVMTSDRVSSPVGGIATSHGSSHGSKSDRIPQNFDRYAVLGQIKPSSQPPAKVNKLLPHFEGDRDEGKTCAESLAEIEKSYQDFMLCIKPTQRRPSETCGPTRSSKTSVPNPVKAVGQDDKSLRGNHRRHELLTERVRAFADRIHARGKLICEGKTVTCNDTSRSCRQTNICTHRVNADFRLHQSDVEMSCSSIASKEEGGAQGRSTLDGSGYLVPHPPTTRHVVVSFLVEQYRKRRFKYAKLRSNRLRC